MTTDDNDLVLDMSRDSSHRVPDRRNLGVDYVVEMRTTIESHYMREQQLTMIDQPDGFLTDLPIRLPPLLDALASKFSQQYASIRPRNG